MKISDYSVPGKQVKKLVCVTGDNNNKFYHMFEQNDGNFKVVYGRIESTSIEHSYPMSDWDKKYREKTKKGYNDITHLYTEKIEADIKDATTGAQVTAIQNAMVRQLIDELQAYANKTIKENYSVTQEDVTQAQVDEAQKILDNLVGHLRNQSTSTTINDCLLKLYRTVPRKMAHVKNHLVESGYSTSSLQRMLDDEQKLLDVMAGQVEAIKKQKEATRTQTGNSKSTMDMLEVLGLEVKEVSSKEAELIKKMMGNNSGQYKRAFSVVNKKTEGNFKSYVAKAKNQKCELFWHGSRNENWMNILQTGLLIRPAGVIITGAMYGNSVYFADKAQKSIGYTSLSGSYWAKGCSKKAFLAIYDVHVGNQKHIYNHTSACYDLNKKQLDREGFDSVYAHAGTSIRNNEFMVYSTEQSTIRYIVEIIER